jgi:hypothetical protein
VRDVLALEQDGAGRHRVGRVPHERVGQRRLAGAVRAHEGVDLAGLDGQVDAPQDGPSSAETWRSRISSSGGVVVIF